MKNLFKFMFLLGVFLSCFAFGQIDPSNSKNPYDYIGVAHNKGLDGFIKNYKNIEGLENNKHLNLEVLINSNTNYLGNDESLLQFNSKFSKDENLKNYFKYLTSENPDYIKALEKINFSASEDFKVMYQTIFTEGDKIDFSDIKTLEKFIIEVKSLEEKISKSAVSSKEKELLFAASSVSRFSAVYWFKELNSNSEWNPQNVVAKMGPGKRILFMDVSGAIGGGVAGAIVGGTATVFVVGIGAIPGWAAGAIGGAIAGSIGQGAYELLEWMFG